MTDTPVFDAQAVASRLRAAGCVFAEDEAQLLISTAGTSEELQAMIERRAAGLPLEQVLGWARFCGLRIAVDPGVFVPRRRTEFLVRQAIALVDTPTPVVVDLCCGAGALGLALAAAVPGAQLHAADIEPAAVRCARRNLGARGAVYEGDLFDPLPGELRARIDVLLANVPYVPTDEIDLLPPEARLHEPHVALDGGVDGLDVLRRVAGGAARWLAPGGQLLVETSERQATVAAEVCAGVGLTPRVVTDDDLGATVLIATVLIATVLIAPRPRPVGP
jgi:release factor glutamine methyltransferase